jgi:hypothetical protein
MNMAINYQIIDKLAEDIKTYKTIAIDGVDGSGKTYLANQLGIKLGIPVLNTDDNLTRDRGNYVKNLNIKDILKSIKSKESFIIHGVCLLEILSILNISSDCFIYVKRINIHGEWVDEEECYIMNSPEEKIRMIENYLKTLFPTAKLTEFRKEVIRYHSNYKPYTKAIIFERVENN